MARRGGHRDKFSLWRGLFGSRPAAGRICRTACFLRFTLSHPPQAAKFGAHKNVPRQQAPFSPPSRYLAASHIPVVHCNSQPGILVSLLTQTDTSLRASITTSCKSSPTSFSPRYHTAFSLHLPTSLPDPLPLPRASPPTSSDPRIKEQRQAKNQ